MSRKRRNTSSPEPDEETPSAKRRNTSGAELNYESEEEEKHQAPYVDEFSGQAGAFPGLGGDSGELFYGPASDGIDYLKMVRSEAKGVPHILTAPVAGAQQVESEQDEQAEDGGYYFDGAYTAINNTTTAVKTSSSPPAVQMRYYDSLLAQFRLVQATLRCSPPLSAVETLRPEQFISFPEDTRKVQARWEAHLLSNDPHPVQLACMDTHTVVGLVRFLTGRLEKMLRMKDQIQIARVGAWVWAILGKCRDRGELSSEEVGDLRELAQMALQLQRGGCGGITDSEEEDVVENETAHDGDSAGTEAPVRDAEGEMPTTEQLADGDMGRLMLLSTTLDMIVTIVGEFYGQRDLLDLRTRWTDEV